MLIERGKDFRRHNAWTPVPTESGRRVSSSKRRTSEGERRAMSFETIGWDRPQARYSNTRRSLSLATMYPSSIPRKYLFSRESENFNPRLAMPANVRPLGNGSSQTMSKLVIHRRQLLQLAPVTLAGGMALAGGEPAPLRAGVSQVDVTLPLGATNGGIIMRGAPAERIHDPLHIRCLALDDGETKMVMAVCDLRMIERAVIDRGKAMAAEAIGWPLENMLVSATHSHAAPGLVGRYESELDRWYAEFVSLRIADAIRDAVRGLQPARIGWTQVAKPEHVFNRRWFVASSDIPANPFGEHQDRIVMNPNRSMKLIEPAGPVDSQLSIVSVQTIDGTPLAMLANYGLHYVGGYQGNQISSDYFGLFSRRIAELLQPTDSSFPFVAMISNGASGDVNNTNFLEPRKPQPPWMQMRTVAEDLAQTAVEAVRGIEYRTTCRLRAAQATLSLKLRRPSHERLDWARKLLRDQPPTRKLSRPQIYAQEAIELAGMPETTDIILQAFRLDDLGILAAPCEVFAETGLAMREASPTATTFTVELANGYSGYLPTPRQHALGGYETWSARSSQLEIQASEKIQQELLRLLHSISGAS
jgi:neutral ceramidase